MLHGRKNSSLGAWWVACSSACLLHSGQCWPFQRVGLVGTLSLEGVLSSTAHRWLTTLQVVLMLLLMHNVTVCFWLESCCFQWCWCSLKAVTSLANRFASAAAGTGAASGTIAFTLWGGCNLATLGNAYVRRLHGLALSTLRPTYCAFFRFGSSISSSDSDIQHHVMYLQVPTTPLGKFFQLLFE